MSFDWREFLVLAHHLRRDPSESSQRTSVGRACYYVYNHCLEIAKQLSFQSAGGSTHRQLWSWYQRQPDPNLKPIGILGDRMRCLRVDADDRAPPSNWPVLVPGHLQRARDVEVAIAKFRGNQPSPPL